MRYTNTPKTSLKGLNAELVKVEEAFKDVLDRKDEEANFMDTDLDMNSHRILNLPSPVLDQEPLRKGDAFPFYDQTESFRDEAVQAAEAAQASASSAQGALDELLATVTTQDLINGSMPSLEVGSTITTTGFYTAGDGGGAQWLLTSNTNTPSQSPAHLGDAKLTDSGGREWALVFNRQLFMPKIGLSESIDNRLILKLAANVIQNNASFVSIAFPTGEFTTTAGSEYVFDINGATEFSIIGNATTISLESGAVGSPMRIQNSTRWVFQGISLKCNQTVSSGFHGFAITDCQEFDVNMTSIYDPAGYGFGLQGDLTASYEKSFIRNFKIYRASADGIDFKNYEENNKAMIISNGYIEDPSWLNELKPAIDIRGAAIISNIAIVYLNNTNFNAVGIRTRPTGSGLIGAQQTVINNVTIEDKTTGMSHVGMVFDEFDTVASNITVRGVGGSGFQIGNNGSNLQLTNCIAKECGNGFFNGGENTKLINCMAIDSVSEGFRSSGTTSSTYISCESINSGTYGFRAAAATGVKLAFCKSSGSGVDDYSVGASARVFECTGYTGNTTLQGPDSDYVKFGELSALGSETLSGYVYIRDINGTLVKLAVVS